MAVGVVDVLPRCLSSVYLFWDADFAHLAPGKLTALKEIEWVQQVCEMLAAEPVAWSLTARQQQPATVLRCPTCAHPPNLYDRACGAGLALSA